MTFIYCNPICSNYVVHKTPNARGWIFSLRCARCQRLRDKSWIPHKDVDMTKLHEMPIWAGRPADSCPICGKIGLLESHHLAPQAKFADSELWPKIDVCVECHDRWHRVMG